MATLNIRGVSEDVYEELKRIASESGVSLNSLVVNELAAAATRRGNSQLVESFRKSIRGPRPSNEEIVAAVRETREGR